MLTVEQIIAQLNADASLLPREALEQAILQQEAITPALLDTIENVAKDPLSIDENPAFTYALYLLAQFRENKAYPLIVKYFGEIGLDSEALDPTGDIVTEDLNSILASVCHGDLSLIKQLIEDPQVNEYVRSAALGSLVILYNTDKLSREDLVGYIETLFDPDEDPFFVSRLVAISCAIHPKELYDKLVQCFDEDLVEVFFVDRKYLDERMQMDIETVLAELKGNRQYQLINDAISDMDWWSCFSPETNSKKFLSVGYEQEHKSKVGRNDPCPCGSGKKYKKCCLN
jgi:hypothetical protein